MTEPLGAGLLKDLRGLSYPPTFDGNDADYQDFRFSFRIDMSFVSVVSHLMMDKCEAERNQITLASVKLLGEAHLKCCTQIYRRSWPECFSEGAFYKGQYWLPPKFVGKADLGGRLAPQGPMDSMCLRTASMGVECVREVLPAWRALFLPLTEGARDGTGW